MVESILTIGLEPRALYCWASPVLLSDISALSLKILHLFGGRGHTYHDTSVEVREQNDRSPSSLLPPRGGLKDRTGDIRFGGKGSHLPSHS